MIQTTSAKRGKPRRNAIPLWRRRPLIAVAALMMVVASIGGGWWLWQDGLIGRTTSQAKWKMIAWSGEMGFKVEDILVVGRRETTRREIFSAIGLVRGAPILAFDLNAAKARVEALPWINKTSLERMLPNTILLRVEERRPMAIWQHKGQFALIDTEGKVILKKGLGRFADLLVVVGKGAPDHTAELIKIMETQPHLQSLVKAAVRVGGRRWNIRLAGGIDIRLPEQDPVKAWARLSEFESKHKLLAGDIKILDMRQADRLIVRRHRSKDQEEFMKGHET
ncbi:MAG: FtsQ-type POTRA domain-containing protein [Rhodospirillaceae bacterium]|jgi:cell division protein FtsQ|nr:FtsQ-type POTRA domain-containing protein [Rhodospirillaceae bacterium]MBT4702848.1 FtsQ-type POTRA domain-containing protein [Rhodospirillaceae bacterium]MBT5036619.1 FtsQ-type POTRA domain-containing protein [Rhodospirillaceae bacterium]MBT6221307.1 FtsQ-type POTRA domain-containing protein [Rhodospirillaceae bacterium]MBT6361188.1 FtsQ-type POTRA domain-containing protein [Rhodospirillaceae bacterium]